MSASPRMISSYASWAGARTQSKLKRSPSDIKAVWLDSQAQARRDFRARSKHGCLWVLVVLWFGGLTTGFIILCAWSSTRSTSWSSIRSLSACQPDDQFSLRPENYRYWSHSGFFQITIGTGDLTFTEAKAIDVIWDIVVGRGGQGLLAYLSWEAFVRYVTTSMEVQPVTFNTYRMIFLQNESLILGIPRIIRDFCKRRSLHSRFAMVFMVLTMIFVLVFPTLGSAMTGYSGNVMPYVPDADENFLPFHDFRIALYTIHDGSRINQTDNFHVTIYIDPDSNDNPRLADITHWYMTARYVPRSILLEDEVTDCAEIRVESARSKCEAEVMAWDVSNYVGSYGTSPQANGTSTFHGVDIGSPNLNITAYDLPGFLKSSPSDDRSPTEVYVRDSATFISNNVLYDQATIMENGRCQAQKTYQWGFSFIQLNIMIILLWSWTLGIITMYISAKFTRLQRGRGEVAGEYKAVFELSDAMHAQLDEFGEEEAKEVRQITESDLRRRITKDLRGGTIAYDTALLPENDDLKGQVDWTFKAWAMREVWWLLGLACALIIDGIVVYFLVRYGLRSDIWFLPALPFTIGFAMYVGLTHRSRLMVLLWGVLVMCVLPAIILGAALGSLTRV